LLFTLSLLTSPKSTHFPYTTLLRSRNKPEKLLIRSINSNSFSFDNLFSFDVEEYYINDVPFRLLKEEVINAIYYDDLIVVFINRSEEHTSELQSRENLVCRLLLEKK